MRKINQNDPIGEMIDDDCPLCQMMSGKTPERGKDINGKGDFFINVPFVERVKGEIMNAMRKARVSPEIIYAFDKTGLLPSEDRIGMYSDQNLKEWHEAIEEFKNKKSYY